MNNAVEELRSNQVRSIEQIMLDQVINYIDGQGPCTTVECLLTASIEAARIFILEKEMMENMHPVIRPYVAEEHVGEYSNTLYHGDDRNDYHYVTLTKLK